MAHSEKESERSLVNGEQSRSQRIIGLSFTVYVTLCALRLALCIKGAVQSRAYGSGFFAHELKTLPGADPYGCKRRHQ